jgi:2-methylcitrate dehydratase PrpD
MEITRSLARFVVQSEYLSIPDAPRREAVRSLFNWIGCAIGGARHEAVERALEALKDYARLPQATVLGRSERLDTLHAALINGISSHVLDFDDTDLRTLLHPSVPVAAALMALAERRRISGPQLIHAFILGVEVEGRIANAIYANHNLDWYITGTVGPFGAAAAAGKVLGLDEQQMVWALGIAATEGAGLRQMAGTMAKAFVHGRAGQNGLYAAMLASSGFTSSDQAIEGPHGFARTVGRIPDARAVARGLGESYQIMLNTYKPYACGVVAHPVIDGCLSLREQHALEPNGIQRVRLRVHSQALKLTGIKSPRSGLESKWSIYHSAAVALVRGRAGEHEYSDQWVLDRDVSSLRNRIEATDDARLRQDEAHLSIFLVDGRVLEHHVEHAVGSVARPMSDAELEAKFVGLVEHVFPTKQIDGLVRLCWSAAELEDIAEIARMSVPAQADAKQTGQGMEEL